MGMAVIRTLRKIVSDNKVTARPPRGQPSLPSKLTRYPVEEGLPAPEPRQLVLDVRVLAQLVRDGPGREGAAAGVVRSADVLLEENDLGHDPYLVVRLREEVEPDARQPDPERLVPGAGALIVVVVVAVSSSSVRGRGPGLALSVTGTPGLVFSRGGSDLRIGGCCPVHADTWGPPR